MEHLYTQAFLKKVFINYDRYHQLLVCILLQKSYDNLRALFSVLVVLCFAESS